MKRSACGFNPTSNLYFTAQPNFRAGPQDYLPPIVLFGGMIISLQSRRNIERKAMRDKTMNILLVEDDEVDIMTVQRAFKRVNITNPLYVAKNGLDALNMLRGNGKAPIVPWPRIILLGINMPKMNGIEFLRELRADPELRQISVVVPTTSNDERDIVAAYNLNVAGYILKPVVLDRLIEAMATLDKYWTLSELP